MRRQPVSWLPFCLFSCLLFISGPHEFHIYFGFCDLRRIAGYLTGFSLVSLVPVSRTKPTMQNNNGGHRRSCGRGRGSLRRWGLYPEGRRWSWMSVLEGCSNSGGQLKTGNWEWRVIKKRTEKRDPISLEMFLWAYYVCWSQSCGVSLRKKTVSIKHIIIWFRQNWLDRNTIKA